MQSSESILLSELESHGFEIEELKEEKKKPFLEYVKEAFADLPERENGKAAFGQAVLKGRDGDLDNIRAFMWVFFAIGLVISLVASVVPELFGVVLFSVMAVACFGVAWAIGRECHQDAWVYGLWRWLTDWSGLEPLTEEEVVEHLSDKLKEEKERALGVTVAEEKQKLKEVRKDLKKYLRTLRSQRKGGENHGLTEEIDAYISAIKAKITEIDEAIARIDEFLDRVRQLAEDIAAEILPVYRRRRKILQTFEGVPVSLEEADQSIESAEKKLEQSRLALEDKLGALQKAVQKANHVSAELSKLSTKDLLDEKPGETTIDSVNELTVPVDEDEVDNSHTSSASTHMKIRS